MDFQGIIMVIKNRPFLRGMMVILGGVDTLRFPADDSQLVSVSHRLVFVSLLEALLSAKQGLLRQGFFQQRSCLRRVLDEKKYLPIHEWLTFTHPIRFGCPAGSDLVTILNTLII